MKLKMAYKHSLCTPKPRTRRFHGELYQTSKDTPKLTPLPGLLKLFQRVEEGGTLQRHAQMPPSPKYRHQTKTTPKQTLTGQDTGCKETQNLSTQLEPTHPTTQKNDHPPTPKGDSPQLHREGSTYAKQSTSQSPKNKSETTRSSQLRPRRHLARPPSILSGCNTNQNKHTNKQRRKPLPQAVRSEDT